MFLYAHRTHHKGESSMNATHTKTPYKSDGRYIYAAADGAHIAECGGKEDAAHIVRCVNAHDVLVSALRGMLNARGPQSEQAWAILEHDARAALAKAGAA